MKQTTEMTETERTAELEKLGLILQITSGPVGDVSGDPEKQWPHVKYTVRLVKGERVILETTYSMGIGCVDVKKTNSDFLRWTDDESSMLHAMQSKPHANYRDKALQARVCAKLAKLQKVTPTLASVMYSLLIDGEAYFSGQTFEEWAAEFGESADSRKAEALWRVCDTTGRKLSALGSETLASVREIMEGF